MIRVRAREWRLTSKQLVAGNLFALAVACSRGQVPSRRTHDLFVDAQVRPIPNLLGALLTPDVLVVQEPLEVQDQDGRKLVERELLRRVLRDRASLRRVVW